MNDLYSKVILAVIAISLAVIAWQSVSRCAKTDPCFVVANVWGTVNQ